MKSPFGRADCVAYQYEIEREGRDPRHRHRLIWLRDYWGMVLWPCQVETAAGPVRIFGYARLGTPGLVLEDADAYRAADVYLRHTTGPSRSPWTRSRTRSTTTSAPTPLTPGAAPSRRPRSSASCA